MLKSNNVFPSRNWVNDLIVDLYRKGYSFDDIEKIIVLKKLCLGWNVSNGFHISSETKNRLISIYDKNLKK